jgi:outer membrane murein-binding lipoprotein Lpp
VRTKILSGTLLVGIIAVSGCITGTEYQQVSPQVQSLNADSLPAMSNAVAQLDNNRAAYRNCLVEAYIARNIEFEKTSEGRVPDSVVKSSCASFRNDFYSSVWASSYPLHDVNTIEFRHNTARTVLRETDEEMFSFLSSKFPTTKTVTQQYVDDVRAAQ